jgi:hypothetical protein
MVRPKIKGSDLSLNEYQLVVPIVIMNREGGGDSPEKGFLEGGSCWGRTE